MVERGTPERECCILEQDTFTSEKVLVIPRKRWLHPYMTEKIVDWDVKPQPKPKKNNILVVGCHIIALKY